MQADGFGKRIELTDGGVHILRRGVLGKLLNYGKGDKHVAWRSITGVELKPVSLMHNGFIQILFQGSPEARGTIKDAPRDENTVVFGKRQQAAFEAIRDEILRRIA